jgi:hypothetical protein
VLLSQLRPRIQPLDRTDCLPAFFLFFTAEGGWMEAAAYTEAEEALSLTESVSRREVGVGGGGGGTFLPCCHK